MTCNHCGKELAVYKRQIKDGYIKIDKHKDIICLCNECAEKSTDEYIASSKEDHGLVWNTLYILLLAISAFLGSINVVIQIFSADSMAETFFPVFLDIIAIIFQVYLVVALGKFSKSGYTLNFWYLFYYLINIFLSTVLPSYEYSAENSEYILITGTIEALIYGIIFVLPTCIYYYKRRELFGYENKGKQIPKNFSTGFCDICKKECNPLLYVRLENEWTSMNKKVCLKCKRRYHAIPLDILEQRQQKTKSPKASKSIPSTSVPHHCNYCRKCGAKLFEDSDFCHVCGTALMKERLK